MGLQDGPDNGPAHLASNHLPRLTAPCSLDSPEPFYSLASLGYYCFSRYINTFFYAFGMLVPINVLLAFINPKSPNFPQALYRLSLSALSLSCSPLAFWLKIDFESYYGLPDCVYGVCICLSQWTRNPQWTVISPYIFLPLLQHCAQFLHRKGVHKSLLACNKIHKLYKITSLDGFLLNRWTLPAFR